MAGQPAADIAERDDVVAVIVHQRRHGEIGEADRSIGAEHKELVVGHFGLEGMTLFVAPAGQKAVDADRIDDGTRKNMGANLAALLQHNDRKLRIDLLRPDCSRQACRPRADNDNVEFHAFAFNLAQLFLPTSCSRFPIAWSILSATVSICSIPSMLRTATTAYLDTLNSEQRRAVE